MSSGSYFPSPVMAVEIPKKSGGTRRLGIPTITDRVAQMVARMYVEQAADLEEEITQNVSALLDERNMIVDQIHELDTPSHIALLYEKYVYQKNLGQIARELNFSYEYVKRCI